ncbi:SpoIIE family protein phosphatase [Streptomyces sp. NPDC005820]|uniref:SpoIIE family protein phosphatase n=1 Tax=Streptomyces sp. NPDC005820 TaxID=3157069 RepID=UPI0033F30E10
METGQVSPFDTTTAATIVIDPQGLVIGWNRAAETLFGPAAGDVLGRPIDEILHDATGRRSASLLGADLPRCPWSEIRKVRRPDGTPVTVVLQFSTFDHQAGGAACVIVAATASQTQKWMTDQSMLQGLSTQSPIALTVYGPDLRVRWINDVLQEQMGLTRSECIGRYNTELLPQGMILSPEYTGVLEDVIAEVRDTGEPVFDLLYNSPTPADLNHQRIWSCSYFGLADTDGSTLGVCESAFDITNRYEARLRVELLGRASRIGTSLDVVRTAQDVASVAVPDFADRAEVDLAELVIAGDQPSPAHDRSGTSLRRVAERSAQSPPDALPRLGLLVSAETDGPRRMVLPLAARDAVLGSVTFVRTVPRHPFTAQDVTLAQELVSRAAVCIDNACRYTREHTTALTLQRSLLPQVVPQPTAVEVAHRYVPTAGPLGVGGDWYDVIPLSGARVGLVVGDVVGHGLNAAATMGRLRTTVRALAALDLAPDELLARLDDLVGQARVGIHRANSDAPEDQALGTTCLYAVYDSVTGTCTVASAGHPAPVVTMPGHPPEPLDMSAGPPLGIGGLPFECAEIHLPEGSVLALYTDGLIASRLEGMDSGMASLRQALVDPAQDLDVLCDTITAPVSDGSAEDDVTLLLVRVQTLPGENTASWRVTRDPSAVAGARESARGQLAQWGLKELAFVTELVVSELVTNAIRYGSDPVTLRMLRDQNRTLICEVSDGAHTSPYLRRAANDDEGGRGLFLVAQCTDRWGTRYTREGKTIWAEVTLALSG